MEPDDSLIGDAMSVPGEAPADKGAFDEAEARPSSREVEAFAQLPRPRRIAVWERRTTSRCVLVSDLHGHAERYDKLHRTIEVERPGAVFLAGDLLAPGHGLAAGADRGAGVAVHLLEGFRRVRRRMGPHYPAVLLIPGNDDPRIEEPTLLHGEREGLWECLHERHAPLGAHRVYGYAFVPPTPFSLKDWERYDVSSYVAPGCVSPEEGTRSVETSASQARYATIADDLERLIGADCVENAVFLFHSPPYGTKLDRAALDGRMIDHVPLDVHVGSIAIRRMIERRQPLVTLHGHVHESARLTGAWRDRIGRTHLFSAAHDGPELALVRFDLEHLDAAERELV